MSSLGFRVYLQDDFVCALSFQIGVLDSQGVLFSLGQFGNKVFRLCEAWT